MPSIRFRLNGAPTEIDADPDSLLLGILRGRLGVMGPHFGCGSGECGACRVIVGDHAVTSCDAPLWSVADKDVTTLEGLGSPEHPHPLQRADRKSTRLNSSHPSISYAVFCLKKKNKQEKQA